MEKVITCNINLFDAEQSLYAFSDGQHILIAKIPLEHINKALPELCNEKQIYNVHLFGHADFVNPIADAINKAQLNNYSENKIKVEVN